MLKLTDFPPVANEPLTFNASDVGSLLTIAPQIRYRRPSFGAMIVVQPSLR